MAINKVIVNGETKLDLTADTVTVDKVQKDITFHDATGALKTGTANIGVIRGYYIKEVPDFSAPDYYDRVYFDVDTDGKYCIFTIATNSNGLYFQTWSNGQGMEGSLSPYVISDQPINNVSWRYEINASSSY